ncbi:MAG: SpoIIE family protein phosphatase [Oscillospiraceae bacterium]|nr:SpoIIE family protein phosphatase [Oscillospiraceae bacterium]
MKQLPPKGLQRLMPLAVPTAQMALSFLLTAGRFSGSYAPFSLALVAAAGARLPGLFCLVGAGAGSLVFLDFQSGLRHFAAAVLIYAANTAFFDSRLYRRPLFRPIAAAAMMLLVQSIYLLHRSAEQWMLCLVSAAVLSGSAWVWRSLWQQPDKPARLLAFAAAAVALQPVSLLGSVSLGRVLAAGLAAWAALDAGLAEAISIGAAVGVLMDLSAPGPYLLFTAAYGSGAAAASLCRRRPRLAAMPAFCLSALVSAVVFRADVPAAVFYEAVVAVLVLLPLRRAVRVSPPETQDVPPSPEAPFLHRSAAAFRELYDSFFRGTSAAPPENPSVLFDQAAERVCRSCVLCTTCWHQNYTSTYNAFNDACPKLLQRGWAQPKDFPLYFSSRCVHFSEFVGAVNVELRAYLMRRQYRQRLLDARREAQEQYQQLGEALASSAVHAVANVTAPMGYRIGSALRPKEGERLCGDQVASFEVGSTLYLLLSDGMGSGENAHREAAMTVRLLQQFLEAGIDASPALQTLNGALRLRGEEVNSFTTIDLLALERGNGTATVYKYGAAPSYVKRTGTVARITGQSLPAGLQRDPPEATRVSLQPGSCFIMISDGIADETNDEWLQNLIAGWQGSEADELVSLILRESRTRKGLSDDCAVVILQLPSRGENGKKQV